MLRNSMVRAVAALGLSLTLSSAISGCTTTAQQAQIDAGAAIGRAAASINLERQPDECGQAWLPLTIPPGEDKAVTVRRYDAYVMGPISERAFRCYWFNENQRIGLTGR